MTKKKSIIVKNMCACVVCGTEYNIHVHHVFEGPDRKWSEKFKLLIPLCGYHHNLSNEGIHNNQLLNLHWKQVGQEAFEKAYPDLKFTDYFRKNYKEM